MAFWFAAAIPVVVVFYLLKRKRVVRLVPSTMLWQKYLAETQASAPFQKLRHNWLLILQILLLLLAILALARPYFAGKTTGGRIHVVVLDSSASMQSTDETPSRFEKARADALKLVDSLHENDLMVVLQAGAATQVKQSATSDKGSLRRAIQSAEVADTPTRLQEALKLAETLIQNNPAAQVHLFSDGAVSNLEQFENSGLPLVYHRIGNRSNNRGITTLDVRTNPENPAERAVFTSVANYSPDAHETQVEFRLDDQLLQVKPVRIPPGETVPMVFIAQQRADGVFSVKIAGQDDLAVDDEASVVSVLPQPVKVLLVSPGNQLLAKALRVGANVELAVQSTLTDDAAEFDVVVLDNVNPVVWPKPNVLAFRSADTNWFETMSTLETPAIVDWRSNHPVLRFVGFDDVRIVEALGVKTPTWAVSLVDAPDASLVLAGELGRQRIVWVSFDPLQSTWPLRVSFPIFIANSVEWLNPAAIKSGQLAIQAGSPFRLALAQPVETAQVQLPDGTAVPWEINPTKAELIFGHTRKRGVYRVTAGTNEVQFAVNLLDASESNTTPKSEIQFGKYARVGEATERRANLELWRWIAVVALAVLMFEWWYYHRRTA